MEPDFERQTMNPFSEPEVTNGICSRNFRIIVIGCAAISIIVALRFITYFEHSPTPITLGNGLLEGAGDSAAVMRTHPASSRVFKQFNQDQQPMDPARIEHTVTVNYDLRSEKEAELIGKMNYALTNSETPIVVDERTLRKLVLVRIKGDWSKVPEGPDWADNEMWQRHSADQLKQQIGYLLPSGTNEVQVDTENGMTNQTIIVPAEPDTIRRVLGADIGTTVPPMLDYEIHD